MYKTKKTLVSLAVAAATFASLELQAAVLEEVIVTAQKREQSLQDIPVSVSAFDAEAIRQQGISDIEDASQYLPNVQIAESPAGSTGATIGIRGSVTINPAVTWEPTVGIYLDGVFIAKNVGGIFEVADLERVEVLRGPQGTLYGKNTVGGAINLVTRQPSEEQHIRLLGGVGNYGASHVGIKADSGRVGNARFSLSYLKRDRDGFDDNTATGEKFKSLDAESGRIAAVFDISEHTEVQYSYDWSDMNNLPAMPQVVPAPVYERPEGIALDGAKFDLSTTKGHSLTVTSQLSDQWQFKSITAKRDMSFDDALDLDGAPMTFFHTERHVDHSQLSQEFQWLGETENAHFVLGAFYFNEDADADNPYDFGLGFPIRNFYGVESTSTALFGQVDWRMNDQWSVIAGLRYTNEKKDFYISHPDDFVAPFTTDSSDTWTNTSPSLTLQYQLSEDTNTYLRVAQGWKSGGFNGESENLAVAQTPYDEETVTSVELGVKSSVGDSVQWSAAIFNNDIKDLQLSEFLGASGYSQITNAGQATITGAEFELVAALTDALTVNVNYGYLDPKYDSFIQYGFEMKDMAAFPYAPENTYSVGASYQSGDWSARVDYSYVDDHVLYYDQASAASTAVKGYGLLNARVSLANIAVGSSAIEVSLWGKNLSDEEYYINGIPLGPVALNYFGNPRTVGLDLELRL